MGEGWPCSKAALAAKPISRLCSARPEQKPSLRDDLSRTPLRALAALGGALGEEPAVLLGEAAVLVAQKGHALVVRLALRLFLLQELLPSLLWACRCNLGDEGLGVGPEVGHRGRRLLRRGDGLGLGR